MGLLSHLRGRTSAADAVLAELDHRVEAAERILGAPAAEMIRGQTWGSREPFRETPIGVALAGADDETLRGAALWAHRAVCTPGQQTTWPASETVTALSRRKLAWTQAEVGWAIAATLAGRGQPYDFAAQCRLPVAAAERLVPAERAPFREAFAQLRGWVERVPLPADERRRLVRRLEALCADPGVAVVQQLPASLLPTEDPFGAAVRAEFGPRLEAAGVPALLVHAASATGPQPSARWRNAGRELLETTSEGASLLRSLLERALAHRETRSVQHWSFGDFVVFVWVHESTARLLRGVVLLAGGLEEAWVTPVLGDLAVYAGGGNGGSRNAPRDLLVANAAVAALARRDGSVVQLARVQARLTHRGVLKGVGAALDLAAARAGLSRAELLETTVPTYGLDSAGRRAEQVGASTAVLAVDRSGVASLTFRDGTGRRLSGVPAAVTSQHSERLAELRAELRELKKTLVTERARVEGLLADGRTWTFADWTARYRDHPVTGCVARGLLWQVGDRDSWTTGLLQDDASLTAVDGAPVTGEHVRMWHPALARVDEVQAWRAALLDADRRQPFKQAFREIYLLTAAEVETRDHSNRFAAHVLRAPQAQALMRTRGWTGNALGYWDGGYDGHATREFGDWRAEFSFDLLENEADAEGTPSLASSDQVRFSRREDSTWADQPLGEVPPLVFTEAMRDVDLFVGVSSIAADPTWVERGARDHATYWHRVGFGELGESAQIRRETLERLVPRLTIADRCSLTERYLVVRGQLRTYKIHLGSGNILMEPNDEYLCIVPARGSKGPTLFLPFEEDGGLLSVVLSKAFLLATDDAITDRSITSQISRR